MSVGLRFDINHGTAYLGNVVGGDNYNLASKKLHMVCGECNNGWMSNLQTLTMPLLIPLIKGDWHDINAQGANTIALWTAMTTSVIAMSMFDTLGVTASDRAFIRERRQIPQNWAVFIGRITGLRECNFYNRVCTAVPKRKDNNFQIEEPNCNCTTIQLGKLILQSINAPLSGMIPDVHIYSYGLGLNPLHPWAGPYDFTDLPFIFAGSKEWTNIKDEYSNAIQERMIKSA